jgi:hypothetical protein
MSSGRFFAHLLRAEISSAIDSIARERALGCFFPRERDEVELCLVCMTGWTFASSRSYFCIDVYLGGDLASVSTAHEINRGSGAMIA